MKYLHVLMDADMTLIDFKAAQRNALITTYKKYGFPVTEESISFYDELNNSLWKKLERKEITKPELIDCRFKIMCEHFGVEHPGDDSMEMFYQSELAKGHDLMPDAYEVCARLGRHFRLSLVTNGTAAAHTPDGKLLKVIGARVGKTVGALAAPGTVLSLEGEIEVACGEGSVFLTRVLPEGKGRMRAADYIRGRRLSINDILN